VFDLQTKFQTVSMLLNSTFHIYVCVQHSLYKTSTLLLQFGQVVLHTCVAQETHVPCFRARDDDVEQIWPALQALQLIRQHTKRSHIIAHQPLNNRTVRLHTHKPQTGNRRSPPIYIYHLLHYHRTGRKNKYAMCRRARWQIHILYVYVGHFKSNLLQNYVDPVM
jgi:hypothetical protein